MCKFYIIIFLASIHISTTNIIFISTLLYKYRSTMILKMNTSPKVLEFYTTYLVFAVFLKTIAKILHLLLVSFKFYIYSTEV